MISNLSINRQFPLYVVIPQAGPIAEKTQFTQKLRPLVGDHHLVLHIYLNCHAT